MQRCCGRFAVYSMPGRVSGLAVLLALTVTGCSGRPAVTEARIMKEAAAGIPRETGSGSTFQKGEIKILEKNYSGDSATIVLTVGSVNIGRMVPHTDPMTGIHVQTDKIDTAPYRLRLDYEWVGGEWRQRGLTVLAFDKEQPVTMDAEQLDGAATKESAASATP